MPFNVKDNADITWSKSQVPPKVPIPPPRGNSIGQKALIAAFGTVVLGAVVFLVYMFLLRGEQPAQPTNVNVSEPTPAERQAEPPPTDVTTGETRQPSPGPETQTKPTPAARAPGETAPQKIAAEGIPTDGKYTIFVASYDSQQPAAEEVARWIAAGYVASVVQHDSHYRVAVGSFPTVGEAKSLASKLEEGFENGYWIGLLGNK